MRRTHVAATTAVITLLASVSAAQTPQPAIPGLTQGATHERRTPDLTSPIPSGGFCGVTDDANYGISPDKPIKVGGGPMYLSARSRRFLDALRGPQGEGLHITRLGSFIHTDDTMLDAYSLTWGTHSLRIYVDGYHWSDPTAPQGLVCGTEVGLAPPPPDPFETSKQRLILAARLDPSTRPIPFGPDGSTESGVVFDHARLVGRAHAASGMRADHVDIDKLPAHIKRPHFVVIAYAARCNGTLVAPLAIQVRDANGNSPKAVKDAAGPRIGELVPGFQAPELALGVMYGSDLAVPGQIEVTYATTCESAPLRTLFPVTGEAGHVTHRVPLRAAHAAALPPNAQMRVQVFFDQNGEPQFPTYAGGPGALADAAIEAARAFRATPPRVNGAPILQVSTIAIAVER